MKLVVFSDFTISVFTDGESMLLTMFENCDV